MELELELEQSGDINDPLWPSCRDPESSVCLARVFVVGVKFKYLPTLQHRNEQRNP